MKVITIDRFLKVNRLVSQPLPVEAADKTKMKELE
jgi:hypothetical protein